MTSGNHLHDPASASFLRLFADLWGHLKWRRRYQFFLLIGLMLVASTAEMVSLGAVIPFIGVLVSPERAFSYPLAQAFLALLSITEPYQMLMPLTVLFCTAAVGAGLLRLLLLHVSNTFSYSVGADLSIDVYRRTLYQSYAIHISRNSSVIISGITGKIAMLIGSILVPLLAAFSSTVILAGVLFALMMIDPVIAISAGASFGFLYLAIALLSRRRLRENSESVARESTQAIKALQEGLGGIRDVLIDGTQEFYCSIYQTADHRLRLAQARNTFIAGSPRYIMETLGIVMIALLAFGMSQREGGVAAALPVLGALALGAQRVLPALQQGYSALTTIQGAQASLRDALYLLRQPMPDYAQKALPVPIPFQRDIGLVDIGFRYMPDGAWVVRGLNLVIPKGSRVGFVGTTGAGKSTLLDIIMSLLGPTEGCVTIDGEPIGPHNFRAWQAHLAHVPQNIFLADSSIEENIAFGVPKNQIDHDRVRAAASKAQIAEAIEGWPNQYQTGVGERGVRLSGGQRQRVGIARALYKQADVIVLDEATSALDGETERAAMDAIEQLGRELTILIVAHRLTTLRNCDFIVFLDNDGICRTGSYQELIATQ